MAEIGAEPHESGKRVPSEVGGELSSGDDIATAVAVAGDVAVIDDGSVPQDVVNARNRDEQTDGRASIYAFQEILAARAIDEVRREIEHAYSRFHRAEEDPPVSEGHGSDGCERA